MMTKFEVPDFDTAHDFRGMRTDAPRLRRPNLQLLPCLWPGVWHPWQPCIVLSRWSPCPETAKRDRSFSTFFEPHEGHSTSPAELAETVFSKVFLQALQLYS